MTNDNNHNKNLPEFAPEIVEMISGTKIAWSKTREEIWPEMLAKIEGKSIEKKNVKVISLQVFRYAAAAVIAILAGISSVMFFYTKTIETQQAQQVEIFLPDNSRVKVFAQSTLTYKPYLWKFYRSVNLNGEGFFEVQKGKKFEVVSEKGKTIVLGTRFNVYARNHEYNVTCTSGKVKVLEFGFGNEAIITGGQEAVLKNDGNFVIIDKTNVVPAEPDKTPNPAIEEELNSVLKTEPEQEQSLKNEETDRKGYKQASKENIPESNQDKPVKQKTLINQDQVPNRSPEAPQNIEQPKTPDQTQVAGKEQLQDNEKSQAQSTGNSQGKDKFRNSLTPEQLSILENQKMSKEEKRKAFLQSLSSEQKQLLKEQTEERARQAEANKEDTPGANMKDQMKSQVREQMQEGTGNKNMEQQRQQNRGDKEKPNPGGNNPSPGNGSGGDNKKPAGKGN